MSNKKKLKKTNEDFFSVKEFLIKYAKRYFITILIAIPFILVFNYVMSKNVEGYTGVVPFFVSLALLLFACFIGLIFFTKKDDKEQDNMTDEKKHDPFAD